MFQLLLVSALAAVGVCSPQTSRLPASFSLFSDGQLTLNARSETTTTTPVPILRFVDRQNADGSYTYGYESGDGSYKIETRSVLSMK